MKSVWQFIKFGIVGVSNTLISEVVYCVLVYFDVPYLLAYAVGFVVSVLNAYYWSNKYVFEAEDNVRRVWWKVLLKTYAAYLWGFIVSAVLLVLWIDVVKISRFMGPLETVFANCGFTSFDAKLLGEMLAAGLNLLITIPMNFLVNKFWAYKD